MTASASHVASMREMDAEDPVLAAIRRASALPPLPDEERRCLLDLDAEASSDPRTWQGTDELMAKLAKLGPSDEHEDDG